MQSVFLSYATEDHSLASEIAHALKGNGIDVWFAPISLKPGDSLLGSIDAGLAGTTSGILVISKKYLSKAWTSYEMDVLLRQNIETKKRIIPIWKDVQKTDIDGRHPGLAGIVAITEVMDFRSVMASLVHVLSEEAPSQAIVPTWEDPAFRFTQGLGEVMLNGGKGPTTSIYEFLLHSGLSDFPLWVAGRNFSREELFIEVARAIGADSLRVKKWVTEQEFDQLRDECIRLDLSFLLQS
jgi:TIR domain